MFYKTFNGYAVKHKTIRATYVVVRQYEGVRERSTIELQGPILAFIVSID